LSLPGSAGQRAQICLGDSIDKRKQLEQECKKEAVGGQFLLVEFEKSRHELCSVSGVLRLSNKISNGEKSSSRVNA
jgi:hypothetical protein